MLGTSTTVTPTRRVSVGVAEQQIRESKGEIWRGKKANHNCRYCQ
jgi:hypothetical protein